MDIEPVKHSDQKNAGSEYDADEVDFLRAIQKWQKETGRRFPTFVEVLRIAKSRGWRKVDRDAGS